MSWVVVFPVSNIQINANTHNIGNLIFHKINTYNISLNWNFPPNIITIIQNEFNNKIIVEVANINANSSDEAIDIAILELAKVIDLLSIVYNQKHNKILIIEPNLKERFFVLTKDLITNDLQFQAKNLLYLESINLNQNDIRQIGDLLNVFPFLNKSPSTYSKLEKRVANSLHWCRRGNTESRPEDRLKQYMTGFENLLIYEQSGSKKDKIASRSSLLISASSNNQKNNIEKQIKKAYDLRSKIVHEGFSDLTKEDEVLIENIRTYIYLSASRLAQLTKKRKTLQKAISLQDNIIKESRSKKRHYLLSRRIIINNLPRRSGIRTKFYNGFATIKKQTNLTIVDMQIILKFYDDGNYVYVEGYGKQFSNLNLNISSTDKLYIEGEIPKLNISFILRKIEFQDDILLQLPNKIKNNQKVCFIAYAFRLKKK